MDFQYVLRSILALIIIIWLANLVLEKLNDYLQGQSRSIEIIERFSISKNSSLALVKIINRYYVMSLTENKNEILQELKAEEVEELRNRLEEKKERNVSTIVQKFDYSKIKEKYSHYFEDDRK